MDSELRLTSPTPEFDVRAKIDEFSSLLSRTIICFYQYLASDKESEGPRRRLLDEYIAVGGAANSTKILLDTSDERKAEGYLERRKKIESLWVPGGPLAQFASQMGNAHKIMSTAIDNHQKIATPTNRRGPFPLSLEALNKELRLIQEYKQATVDALYDDFYRPNRNLDPKIQLAMDVIEWLGYIDTTDRQEFMSREGHEGTCRWIFNPDVCKRYHEWWSDPEGFLWIRGKLPQSLIGYSRSWEKIEEQEKRDGYKRAYDEPPYVLPEFFPAFYFFDFRDARSLQTSTFLKSLFVQFLQVAESDLGVTFPDLVQRYADGLPPPNGIDAFQDLVLRAMRSHQKKVIFVDGLNECDDVSTVTAFLDKAMQEANVRVLVTNRPDPDILTKYRGRPTINLEDYIGYTTVDMREWLMKRMMDHSRLQAIPEHKKVEILDVVTACAEGSFWHAQCIVDSLEVCRSVTQVNDMIRDAPKDLQTVHYNLLRSVNDRSEDVQLIVTMAVRWLGGALRPLSLSQIIEAVQIELGHTPPLHLNDGLTVVAPEDMLMICGNLVKIDNRIVRLGLGHSTVRTFLTQAPPENQEFSKYFFDAHAIHRDLALRSTTYIMAEDIERAIAKSYTQAHMFDISRRYTIVERCPMLMYVFEGGFEHLRYCTREDDDAIDLLVLLQIHIYEKPDKFREVLQALHDRTEDTRYRWIVEEKELALGILVRFGPPWMLKRYLLRRRDLANGKEKGKLVKWAEKLGRFDLRNMLLEFELPEPVEDQMEVVSEGSEQAAKNTQGVVMADKQLYH